MVQPLEAESDLGIRAGDRARGHRRCVEGVLRKLAVLEAGTRPVDLDATSLVVLGDSGLELGALDGVGARRARWIEVVPPLGIARVP